MVLTLVFGSQHSPAGAPLALSDGAAVSSGANSLSIQPRIFNGVVTFERPQVGLLLNRGGSGTPWLARCTATLIGPTAALTAAHCVCPSSGTLCQPGRRDAPAVAGFRLLLQNDGLLEIAGIAPVPLANGVSPLGSAGEIVGFGTGSGASSATGIKRTGAIATATCAPELSDAQFVCWESTPNTDGANTCAGDSGAPLFLSDDGGGFVLAGVASGGYGVCDGEDLAFDTAVAPVREAIAGMAKDPLAPAYAGESMVRAMVAQGRLSGASPALSLTIEVPEGSARLVVVGNGEDSGGNDHGLRLHHGGPPGVADDACISDQPGVFESCALGDPEPGTWYAEYRQSVGLGGAVQLSATAYSAYCPLDVDGDGRLDALTDGLLILRHLSGRSGTALTDGALGRKPWRDTAAEIAALLNSAACVRGLDLDGDGVREPQTDGRLVLRYLFGFRGAALVEGTVGPGATRATAEEIGAWIEGLIR
jgi:hypothetical protein